MASSSSNWKKKRHIVGSDDDANEEHNIEVGDQGEAGKSRKLLLFHFFQVQRTLLLHLQIPIEELMIFLLDNLMFFYYKTI